MSLPGKKPDEYARAFTSHPNRDLLRIHDSERFGCSPCHQGNGRATTSVEKAHGTYEHWLWPIFRDRKSTRLNSRHGYISYAVFCLKNKVVQPPPPAEPSPPPPAPPGTPPTTEAALLREMQRSVQGLEELARDLTLRSLDLSRQISVLRGMLDATTIRAGSPGAPKALDEDEKAEATAVNFQDVWPPGHKEHRWCRTHDDGKALPTFDELPDDDPLVVRFGR